jgi:predicted nucleic-acid-binding Zn-ribbon protein
MPLTATQRQTALAAIGRLGPRRCPFCNATDALLDESALEVPVAGQQAQVARFLSVTCRRCGHVELFSPRQLGVHV